MPAKAARPGMPNDKLVASSGTRVARVQKHGDATAGRKGGVRPGEAVGGDGNPARWPGRR